MTTQVTQLKVEVHGVERRLSERIDVVERRLDRIDQRLDGYDQRFERLERRFDGLERRFDGLEQRSDQLERKLDAHHDAMRLILADILDRLPARNG